MKGISLNALKSIGFAVTFSLLFFFPVGCGEEQSFEKTYQRKTLKNTISSDAKRSSQVTLEEIFKEESTLSDTQGKDSENTTTKKIQSIEEIIHMREVNPDKLQYGIELLSEIKNELPKKNSELCKSQKSSINPKGTCNAYALLYSKISEIRYYQGNLSPIDDHTAKIHYFNLGQEAGYKALDFNEDLVNALLWTASNLAAWVGAYRDKYKNNIFKLVTKLKTLQAGPAEAEALLHRALKIYPKFDNGGIYLALGRMYHLVPEKYLNIESGQSAADKYLRKANKLKKYKYHLVHYYLFLFYKDNYYLDGAQIEAKWLYKNLKNRSFTRQFPIHARREYNAIMEFFHSEEYDEAKY